MPTEAGADGKLHVGQVLRDPQTGERRVIVQIWRPEDLSFAVPDGCYRGAPTERCALYGRQWRDR